MTPPVALTYEAEREFDIAADWYEDQAGLGANFTVHVREVLNRIGERPESFAAILRDARRAKVRKYPYHIDFRIKAERVEVFAILHNRRSPSVWKNRVT